MTKLTREYKKCGDSPIKSEERRITASRLKQGSAGEKIQVVLAVIADLKT
jgi:hypothetical protein